MLRRFEGNLPDSGMNSGIGFNVPEALSALDLMFGEEPTVQKLQSLTYQAKEGRAAGREQGGTEWPRQGSVTGNVPCR
jgi:hypothetical protein